MYCGIQKRIMSQKEPITHTLKKRTKDKQIRETRNNIVLLCFSKYISNRANCKLYKIMKQKVAIIKKKLNESYLLRS